MEMHSKLGSETKKIKLKDRRVGRTRQLLREALESLILEKPYADITVQDIIDRANVGRSTFYAHFLDKDHLFKSNIEKLRDIFNDQYRKALILSHQHNPEGSPLQARIDATLFLFQHVQSYQPIYKALVGKGGGEWAIKQFENAFVGVLREHISEFRPDRRPQDVPPEVLAQYMARALLGLLTWWLEENLPYTAEQMNKWFHTLTMHSQFEN